MSDLVPFLSSNKPYFLAFHLLAFALGFGGFILADLFLFKFIRSSQVTKREVDVLKTFSKVVWFALILFLISGTALALPKLNILQNAAKFQMKMIAVAVIIVNGILLNTLVSPKLLKIFGKKYNPKFRFFKKLAFGLGAVSFVSWSTAFILSVFRNLQIDFWPLIGIYLFIIISAVFISQLIESRIFK